MNRADHAAAVFTDRARNWEIADSDVDALSCPCGGRLHFIELVTDTSAARVILARLGLPTESPEPTGAAASSDAVDLPPPDW